MKFTAFDILNLQRVHIDRLVAFNAPYVILYLKWVKLTQVNTEVKQTLYQRYLTIATDFVVKQKWLVIANSDWTFNKYFIILQTEKWKKILVFHTIFKD